MVAVVRENSTKAVGIILIKLWILNDSFLSEGTKDENTSPDENFTPAAYLLRADFSHMFLMVLSH